MENAILCDPQFLQMSREGREHRSQKLCIFVTCCVGFPTERLHETAIFFHHDLRRVFGAPLGEEMRHFEMRNAAAVGHFDPAVEFFKTKAVFAVFTGNIEQLYGGAFSAHDGVERRG